MLCKSHRMNLIARLFMVLVIGAGLTACGSADSTTARPLALDLEGEPAEPLALTCQVPGLQAKYLLFLSPKAVKIFTDVIAGEPDMVVDAGIGLSPSAFLNWKGHQYAIEPNEVIFMGKQTKHWKAPGIQRALIDSSKVDPNDMATRETEKAILQACIAYLRTMPMSKRMAVKARSMDHSRLQMVQFICPGNEALAFIAMGGDGPVDSTPEYNADLWQCHLEKKKSQWKVVRSMFVPTAKHYEDTLADYKQEHPTAYSYEGTLPEAVAEQLQKTLHSDYQDLLGIWEVVSFQSSGSVWLWSLGPDTQPGEIFVINALESPIGIIRPEPRLGDNLNLTDGMARIDPGGKPSRITFRTWASSVIMSHVGIYRFEKNGDLTLCVNFNDSAGQENPPEKFNLTAEGKQMLLRLRKVPSSGTKSLTVDETRVIEFSGGRQALPVSSPVSPPLTNHSEAALGLRVGVPTTWERAAVEMPDGFKIRYAQAASVGENETQAALTISMLEMNSLVKVAENTWTPDSEESESRILEVAGKPARLMIREASEFTTEARILFAEGRRFFWLTFSFPTAEKEAYLKLADQICGSLQFVDPITSAENNAGNRESLGRGPDSAETAEAVTHTGPSTSLMLPTGLYSPRHLFLFELQKAGQSKTNASRETGLRQLGSTSKSDAFRRSPLRSERLNRLRSTELRRSRSVTLTGLASFNVPI